MLKKIRQLSADYEMLPEGAHVLCAVSGGADSICLLYLLRQLAEPMGFRITAAHYDHCLRGEESSGDASFTADRCAQWGIPCEIGRGDVAGKARDSGQGLEETARQMRYAFLQDTARRLGCTRIATAHNANDNLETVLLHLVRGTGLQGLTGIQPRRGMIIRPMLSCSRAEIESCLASNGITYRQDSTNFDESYSRNRLRAQVIPVLQQLNPRLLDGISDTVRYLREDNDYLNRQAELACSSARQTADGLLIPASALAQLPPAVAPRAARIMMSRLERGDTDCTSAHLDGIVALSRTASPSATLSLPGGKLVRREYGNLIFSTQDLSSAIFTSTPLNSEGITLLPGTCWQVKCRHGICPSDSYISRNHFWLSASGQSGSLVLRPRKTGDTISLPRRGGSRTLKKLMIEARIPRLERERIPVLADALNVHAVAGFGPHKDWLASPGESALELSFISTKEE